MKNIIIKHSKISGIVVGLVSFPVYLVFITIVLVYLLFGDTQGAQNCGMGGLLVMIVLLFSMGVSFIFSILSGVFISKYLQSKVEYQLK